MLKVIVRIIQEREGCGQLFQIAKFQNAEEVGFEPTGPV